MNYENFVSAVESLALKYQRINPGTYVSINHTVYGLELTCMHKEQMRRQWVDLMLTEYGEKFGAWSEVILCDENRKIMVLRFEDRWREREGYGISKCSPTDQFDEEVGLAVAFAHFREYPIPNFV